MLKGKKKWILLIIAMIIIIAAIVIACISGFNKELLYGNNTRIEVELGFNFEKSKIENIASEIFNKYKIQIAGSTNNTAVITVKEISDEQKTQIIEKINEAYNLQLTEDNLTVSTMPAIDILSIANQYIWALIISTILILTYIIIRFRKVGITQILLKSLATILLSELVAISIIEISRIELGIYIIPILLAIFIIDWFILNNAFEKQLPTKKNK